MKFLSCITGILALLTVTVRGQTNASGSCLVPTNQVTFYVEPGSKSFANCFLSGVPDGFSLTNGTFRAWCIEASAPLDPFTTYTGRVYRGWATNVPARFTTVPWRSLNYLLNHKKGTPSEVQNAVWVLLGQLPDFPYTTNSGAMVQEANQNGPGFVPAPGQPSCVLLAPEGVIQPLVLEVVCAQPGLFLSGPKIRGDTFEFVLNGQSGKRYVVQSSTNFTHWTVLQEITATNHTMTITTTNNGDVRRVYRALEQ